MEGRGEVTGQSLAELYELNQGVQESRSVRLLAASNMAIYITLMERHLDRGVKVAESELAARLERDLRVLGELGSEQSGLQLIKYWANQGWLHRVSDQAGSLTRNVCYLTPEARTVLDFARRMRREDTIATGGSIASIAAGLKRVAVQVGDDPARIRADIELQIEQLFTQLDEIDQGRRPEPNLLDVEDEARTIALQMEQVISDIGQYGSMLNRITTRLLDDPGDTDVAYRDRQRQLFSDFESLFESRERASYMAFTRMVQDPEQRASVLADIAAATANLPGLDPGLREVMSGFFSLVSQQIGEVLRTEQRCGQRIKRFFASGTLEQSRGIARQLNEALSAAQELLKVSLADSRIGMEAPLARPAITSIGALTFKIRDPTPPAPAQPSDGEVNLSAFAALAAQVDVTALAEMINLSVNVSPVSLPEAVAMLESAYLGHVIVLWAWALKQPAVGAGEDAVRVRFRSIDGPDREIEVPRLMFSEPIPTATESLL